MANRLAQATIARLEADLHGYMAEAYRADFQQFAALRSYCVRIGGHEWENYIEDMRKAENRWERRRPASVPRSQLSARATVTARMLAWVADGARRENGGRDLSPDSILTMQHEAIIAIAIGQLLAGRIPDGWIAEVRAIDISRLKGRNI